MSGLVGAVLAGCTTPARPRAEVLECVLTRSATSSRACSGITLKLVPLDTPFVRGRPFRIMYVIQNTGAPRQLRLQRPLMDAYVLDSTGKYLGDRVIVNQAWMDDASLVLPTGGFVGKVFDLRCPALEFAEREQCTPWKPPHSGTLRVVFFVNGLSFIEATESFVDSLHLADTIGIRVVDPR